MNCRNYRTDILLYAEGLLDKEKSQALESHMKECSECRSFMTYVKASFKLIQSEKNAEPNPFLATRILNEMDSRRQPVPPVKRWVPAFAFVILLIAAVIGGINLGKLYSRTILSNTNELQEEMSYFDDLEQEQIETFFMTSNETGNE
ncbi:MAG TPA: zf-HC2 domain-containing protein [Bacteroidales bacterium]|nr:zf-HC2 domain-containing protein [Bacteroidales bacterium]